MKQSAKQTTTSCRAADCLERHSKHLCRVCGDRDSNHRSANCPSRGIVSGTTLETRTRGIAPNPWNSTRAIPRLSYSTLLFHGLLFHGTVFVFH